VRPASVPGSCGPLSVRRAGRRRRVTNPNAPRRCAFYVVSDD